MFRSQGIPARYVSGYLYSADQTEAVRPSDPEVEIQTHAWVEAFVPDHGWWALDPTNDQPAGELHIKIGHGRDYQDVMPLRGVYHGAADHQLGVRVQITRERLAQMTEQ
jgi:transglutaminase-like putative cysteine protease